MAVAFIAGNGGSTSLTSTCRTGTFTIGSETDKALIAFVTWSSPVTSTVTAVVWDPTGVNQALSSFGGGASGSKRVKAYRLANPSAVTNGYVHATWDDPTNGTQGIFAGAFSGAHQTTPATDFTAASGTSTTVSVTVPNTTTDDMVMDSLLAGTVAGLSTGANQTPIGSEASPGDIHWSSYQDGADGGVMSWTLPTSAAWLTGGVRIATAGAGGGGGVSLRPRTRMMTGCGM